MTIKARDPVREAFAACSSGPVYYGTKGHAVNAFDDVLKAHGYCLDESYFADWNGNEGRVNHPVCTGQGETVGCAIFTYYRMQSGRYEFIGYLA